MIKFNQADLNNYIKDLELILFWGVDDEENKKEKNGKRDYLLYIKIFFVNTHI